MKFEVRRLPPPAMFFLLFTATLPGCGEPPQEQTFKCLPIQVEVRNDRARKRSNIDKKIKNPVTTPTDRKKAKRQQQDFQVGGEKCRKLVVDSGIEKRFLTEGSGHTSIDQLLFPKESGVSCAVHGEQKIPKK